MLIEKAMAPYSSILAWKIPWMEEPGGLQSMGSRRVGHDWTTSLSLFTCMHWRRKWQPTPVFLPGESQEWGSLVGCRLWGRSELDMTSDSAATAAAGLPVYHQLPEFTQTHDHQVGDAVQPSHPLSFPSPSAPNPSQHQSLYQWVQWVNSSHEVAKVLEFQL